MAGLNDEKFKQMQDEMSRFEEEIGLPIPEPNPPLPLERPKVIGTNTYNEVQKQLAGFSSDPMPRPVAPPLNPPLPNGLPPVLPPVTPAAVPPPPPPPMFVPHQVRAMPPRPHMDPPRPSMDAALSFSGPMFRGPLPPPPPGGTLPTGPPTPMQGLPPGLGFGPMGPGMMPPCPMPPAYPNPGGFPPQMMPPTARFLPPVPQEVSSSPEKAQQPAPAVLSATPMLYVANPQLEIAAHQAEHPNLPVQQPDLPLDDASKKGNKKNKKEERQLNGGIGSDHIVSSVGKKKEKKNRKCVRTAGGLTWEDQTLAEWEEDDFRLFCGDLGNDVTDEVLTRAFSKYASFVKAKVIRDKRTNKTKGFGFVSFKDPQDFIRATKEMNGRYVGSRPIKLRKSTWRNRSLDVVRKKDKEKAVLIAMLTGR